MSRAKDEMIERQEHDDKERKYNRIASYLNLSLDEVLEAEPSIEPNETNDGGVVGWDIEFHDASSALIKKLNGKTHYRVGYNFFGDDLDE